MVVDFFVQKVKGMVRFPKDKCESMVRNFEIATSHKNTKVLLHDCRSALYVSSRVCIPIVFRPDLEQAAISHT